MRSEAKSRSAGKTTIYLVRHGDVHNPDKIFYERIPGFQLSELGRQQAQALSEFLAKKNITHIYSSPLERTRETTSYIAAHHSQASIVYDERLLEVSSVKRGKKINDLALERWNFYKPEYTRLGGEKLSDIWRRMQHFFIETVKKHAGQEIVVVSHGDPIMVSMIKHKGKRLSLSNIRGEDYVDTAKGFEIVFDGLTTVEVRRLDF